MNENEKEGISVFEISRMAIHNGPGLRTMVHLKGCPLRCTWCSTPESQDFSFQLSFQGEKCIGCTACRSICPQQALTGTADGMTQVNWQLCSSCGRCAQACCTGALRYIGENYTAEQLFQIISKDRAFFESTGGGVTFSGGEPLCSVSDSLLHLLRILKERGISVAFDTTGYVDREVLDRVIPYTDYFLWDLKQMDATLHQRYTGVTNERILENLQYADSRGVVTYLRCPLITGINDNDEHIRAIVDFAGRLFHVKEIDLLPLHHMGISRYEGLGRMDAFAQIQPPGEVSLEKWKTWLEQLDVCVRIIS